MAKPKIALLGFGLAGRIAAMWLSERYQLSVFERQRTINSNATGLVAAAMLAPLAESSECDHDLVTHGLYAMGLWQRLLNTLKQELNSAVFFQQAGSIVVAHPQDQAAMAQFLQRVKPVGGHQVQHLNRAQLAELEPELASTFNQGLYLPREGQLDNHAFYTQSEALLRARNVRFHFGVNTSADELFSQGFTTVIDCTGMGAKSRLLVPSFQLRGVRGEVIRLHAPEVSLTRPVRLMHPRYPLYIVPKPQHQFVIGATQIESQDTGEITVRSALELLSAAFSVHSGFAEAKILSAKAALRPTYADNRPRFHIQQSEKGQHIMINGLYRHGYLLAPWLVEQALNQAQLL